MSLRRSKRVALLAGVVSLGVLVALVLSSWTRILEEYHLQRLKSEDAAVRDEALTALAGVGSARVVPRALAIRAIHPECNFDQELIQIAVLKRGAAGADDLISETAYSDWPFRVEVVNVLRRLSAPEELIAAFATQALWDVEPGVRRWGAEILGGSPRETRKRQGRLVELEKDPDPDVSLWARLALQRIDVAPAAPKS